MSGGGAVNQSPSTGRSWWVRVVMGTRRFVSVLVVGSCRRFVSVFSSRQSICRFVALPALFLRRVVSPTLQTARSPLCSGPRSQYPIRPEHSPFSLPPASAVWPDCGGQPHLQPGWRRTLAASPAYQWRRRRRNRRRRRTHGSTPGAPEPRCSHTAHVPESHFDTPGRSRSSPEASRLTYAARRFRPFWRRRWIVALPARVRIRALNPCTR